jgi:hypothetical protein
VTDWELSAGTRALPGIGSSSQQPWLSHVVGCFVYFAVRFGSSRYRSAPAMMSAGAAFLTAMSHFARAPFFAALRG